MFLQKIRAIFEWIAQKRAAKDREVLNYQWTTYRSDKDDQEQDAQTSELQKTQESSAKKRTRPASTRPTQKAVAPDDFTATVTADASRISPQVEIDVDALFEETQTPSQTKAKKRTAKPKTEKTSVEVKKAVAKTAKSVKATEKKEVKADQTQKTDVEKTSETKPAAKKRATSAKPRVRKVAAAKPEASVEKTSEQVEVAPSTEKAIEVPKKTRAKKVVKATEKPANESTAVKTKTAKTKSTKSPTSGATATDYREIVRANTLKGLQALLQEQHPEVKQFTKKFDMSAYLRDKPEVVEELKVKLAKAKAAE